MKTSKAVIILWLIGGVLAGAGNQAAAQKKVIKKPLKKIIKPLVAPLPPPPAITLEAEPAAPPPPPPEAYEIKKPELPRGIFGFGLNTDLAGGFILGRGSALILAGKITFSDPFKLGLGLGLAEDAVEYKAGLGLTLGRDVNNRSLFSLPLITEVAVYFKERSFFGLDPYAGCGLNLNLIGTDLALGGAGLQLFGGVLLDFGFESGKTALNIGYHSARVGNIRTLEGLTFSFTQPIVL